jgi:murein DD-endopeptidase MepM/ murein hydrolase activator NlpD
MIDNKRSFPALFAILSGFIILGIGVLSFMRVGGMPVIKIEPAMQAIGRRTPVKIDVSEPKRGLTRVKVELAFDGKSQTLADKSYEYRSAFAFWGPRTDHDTVSVEVGKESVPDLKGENAVIRVIVERAGTWLRRPDPAALDLTLPVRLTPPSLQIVSAQTYVAQGGCEAVVYRVGESSVRDGVRSGTWYFPGYALPGGGKQDRFAFFAVPYDQAQANVRLEAEDAAGNRAESTFVAQFFPKQFKSDTVKISDEFMNKVVPEILSQSPEIQDSGELVKNYLAINGDLRRKQNEELKALAQKSRGEFLWKQTFLRMPNSKAMAAFADRRSYEYGDKIIDHQDHLGQDLAVTQQAPIPAANDGVVVLAKYFGIYGNAVIIDHGYGLMSLYGHMSSIAAKEGEKVARGGIIGRTGQTGLAAGDHLHFAILLQGLPVNPVEWWDEHWIKDRIRKKVLPLQ